METVKVPGLWMAVGSLTGAGHPLLWCERGDGNRSGYQVIGYVTEQGYEAACAAAEAYNEQRNKAGEGLT